MENHSAETTTWTSDELSTVGAAVNDRVDAAYRAKYHRYSESMVDGIADAQARSTTLKLVPRS